MARHSDRCRSITPTHTQIYTVVGENGREALHVQYTNTLEYQERQTYPNTKKDKHTTTKTRKTNTSKHQKDKHTKLRSDRDNQLTRAVTIQCTSSV